MLLDAIRAVGGHFSPGDYMFWTRIEGTLWTAADVFIVFYLVRCANLCRKIVGEPPHVAPYAILGATLPFCALIPFLHSGALFFLLELVVTAPHFMLILYLICADARHAVKALPQMLQNQGAPPTARRDP